VFHVSGIPQTENGTNGKWELWFVCCKRETETANFRLFDANGKREQLTSFCLLKMENGSLFSLVS
jgi:hypothetical protein